MDSSTNNEESAKIETRATRTARILKETEDLRKQVDGLNESLAKSESGNNMLRAELTISESDKEMLRAKLDTLRANLDQSESDKKTLTSEIDRLKDDSMVQLAERDNLLKEKLLEMENKVKSLEIGIEKSKTVKAAASKEEENGSSSRVVVNQLNELIKKLEKELRNLDDAVVGVSNNNKKKKMELENHVFMVNELLANLDYLNKSVSANVVELKRVTKVGEHLMKMVLSSIHVENTVTNKSSDIAVVENQKRGFWEIYNSYDDEMKQDFKVYVGFLMFISIFGVGFICAMLLEIKWQE